MRPSWRSPRILRLHLTLAVLLPVFLLLGNWQLHRALSGNTLSWAYTFEWPLFAGYACYLWWKLLHEELAGSDDRDASGDDGKRESVGEQEIDEELAAYNAYLADLNAQDKPKRW